MIRGMISSRRRRLPGTHWPLLSSELADQCIRGAGGREGRARHAGPIPGVPEVRRAHALLSVGYHPRGRAGEVVLDAHRPLHVRPPEAGAVVQMRGARQAEGPGRARRARPRAGHILVGPGGADVAGALHGQVTPVAGAVRRGRVRAITKQSHLVDGTEGARPVHAVCGQARVGAGDAAPPHRGAVRGAARAGLRPLGALVRALPARGADGRQSPAPYVDGPGRRVGVVAGRAGAVVDGGAADIQGQVA
eukprot:766901-Hanusia_phi.AAC.2